MRDIEIIDALKEKAIFSVQDIERIGGFSRPYSKLLLSRLSKRKFIKHVSKNIYTIKDSAMIVACNIATPSYISFWSASSYYGFTEQLLSTIYVASTRNIKKVKFEGYNIRFSKITNFFGYKKTISKDGELFIADKEKLMIDAILNYRLMGNFDEVEKVFINADIQTETIISYLQRINNVSLIKRVGFLIEKHRGIDISSVFMSNKKFKNNTNYIFLNQFSKEYTSTNAKWKVKI